jgi:hypothetical protein
MEGVRAVDPDRKVHAVPLHSPKKLPLCHSLCHSWKSVGACYLEITRRLLSPSRQPALTESLFIPDDGRP